MTAVNVLDYHAGDSYVHDFIVRDQNAKAVNLTGATARWAVARKTLRSVGEPIYIATSVSEITFPSPTTGRLRISVPINTILTPGDYVHELEVTLSTGQSQTIAKGRFVVNPAILLASALTPTSLSTGTPSVGNPVLAEAA